MIWKRRDYFDKILGKKVGILFSKFSLSPNQWTTLSLVFALVLFYFLINGDFLTATFIFAFTAFVDMADGAVAKATNKVTKLGGYLDSVIDRIIEFIIVLGLFLNIYPDFFIPIKIWLLFLLFGSFITTYIRAASFEKGLSKHPKGGILEHTDRLILFFFIILISNFSLQYAGYLIVIMTVLANVSALQRFLKVINK